MKIDGKVIALKILQDLQSKVQKLSVTPHLAIILVGNDPASKAYVKQKKLTAVKIGIKTSLFQYPDSAPTNDLLKRLNDLNHSSKIHGIIVQQPLPLHINLKKITEAIDPRKDVDGFHTNSKFQPPIALAVLRIMEEICSNNTPPRSDFVPPRRWPNGLRRGELTKWLTSKKIVVIGKGQTGGNPIIEVFKKTNIEPLVIDSKTKNPKALARNADIIISAVGKSNTVKPNMLKKGVVLISVGLHKGPDGRLHGDYDEKEIKDIASFYTPTPGGVGPVNVAMLLKNLMRACENFNMKILTVDRD